ncbi:MAG: hypothetical protein AB8B57_17670 [Congregibacter sp.]
MNTAATSTLIGLALEMAGAFLLATEAIGLDRIQSWREHWLETPLFILSASKNEEMERRANKNGMQWFVGLTMTFATMVALAFTVLMGDVAEGHGFSKWLRVPFFVMGLIIGGCFLQTGVFLLRAASSALLRIEESSGKGTIGVTGFILLSSGFVLQTLGILPSIL